MPAIKVTTEIDLDIDTAAKWFCGLDDDQMAKFLVKVATESLSYEGNAENQWYYLGGHLRSCSCVTEATRDMLRKWVYWMEHSDHE